MSGPIVLIHIPKTAGVSFVAVLERNFPGGRRYVPNVFRKPEKMSERLDELSRIRPGSRIRFIHGHIPLSVRERLPGNARFATFLREPVARTYSNYRHVCHLAIAAGREPPLADTIQRHPLIPDNLQARMLCALPDWLTRPADEVLLTAAVAELDRLAFVGLVERFPESLLLAQQQLGLRRPAYRRENVRGGGSVPPEHVEALRAHNEIDLQLYAHAVERLGPLLDGVSPRRARSLARAADGRPGRDPVALRYRLSYVALDARRRLGWQGGPRWRRWRVVTGSRALFRTAKLRP